MMTKNDYDAQERAAKTSENSVKTAQISLLSTVENYKWAVKAWQQPSRKEAACMFLKDKYGKNGTAGGKGFKDRCALCGVSWCRYRRYGHFGRTWS